MPFKKGQSGNPGGRRKDEADIKALARGHSVECVQRLVEWMRSDHPKASPAAAMALLDRGYGKPAQAITGPDGEKLPIMIVAPASGD